MRTAAITRVTKETRVTAELNLDRAGTPAIATNLPLFTHFLTAWAVHGRFGLVVDASGDVDVDPHHLVEDVGIVLGQCVDQALGDRVGIQRFGQRYLPMDEALVLCALDISGRGRLFWAGPFPDRAVNGVAAEVWSEFFHAFAANSRITVHLRCEAGINAHHVYEAAFKALGRALHEAVQASAETGVPSTKGVI